MKHSTPTPTAKDLLRFATLRGLGCVACAQLDIVNGQHIEIHHMLQGGKRMGHLYTIPLCSFHHRGTRLDDLRGLLAWHEHVSIADGSKPFTKVYGSQRSLWEKVQDRLHLSKTWPKSKIMPRRLTP